MKKDMKALKKKKVKYFENTKLNLGCGGDYRKGWVNVDKGSHDVYEGKIKTDMIHNLDIFPYPFPDNHFEEVWMNQVLEHLEHPVQVIKELKRICKNDAIITIRVPHFSSYKSFQDPTHKHFFALNSIDLMKNDCEILYKEFEIGKHPLVTMIGRFFTISPFIYERFLYGYFPIQGIKWILKVKK